LSWPVKEERAPPKKLYAYSSSLQTLRKKVTLLGGKVNIFPKYGNFGITINLLMEFKGFGPDNWHGLTDMKTK
jgi:hypothetical protein